MNNKALFNKFYNLVWDKNFIQKGSGMTGYLIFASLFLGSALAVVVSKPLAYILQNVFFKNASQIPSFNPDIVLAKSYDLINFTLFIICSLSIFFVNFFAYRKLVCASRLLKKDLEGGTLLNSILFLLFAFFMFLQTHFVTYSGKVAIIMILAGQLIYLLSLQFLTKTRKIKIDPIQISNGILAGFYFLLVANHFTTVLSIPLLLLFSSPFFYLLLPSLFPLTRLLKSPSHLLLLFSAFIPGDLPKLTILGVIVTLGIIISRDKFIRNSKTTTLLIKIVYPIAILVLLTYNPLFYLGNFDSVDEGFLLGWLQRLVNGQVLYRDVAVYHPPVIIWALYLFSKVTDFSVYNFRLFLALLQIVAFIIYYFVADRVLQRSGNKFIVIMLVLGFSSTLVRNNVEIRVAMGLLPILLWSFYTSSKKIFWLLLSGIFSSVALFTSLEVGLAVIISLIIVTLVFSSNKIKSVSFVVLGNLIGTIPFVLIFASQGALGSFIEQMSFYAGAFSSGYFNTPVERAISLSFLYWHIIDQYFSSVAWMWEIAQMSLVAGLIIVVTRVFNKAKDVKDMIACSLAIFGIFLFRSALGRSDWYHLIFVLMISTLVLFYTIERLSDKKRYLNIAAVIILLLVFSRLWFSGGFLDKQLFRYQTYGKAIGSYKSYGFERARGILVGQEINTNNVNKLVERIQTEVSPTESIFAYPWMPELYFFTNRKNSTSFDTPYSFFNIRYQQEMIRQLELSRPKLLIYNPSMMFGGFVPGSLPKLDEYIRQNFEVVEEIGPYQIRK